MFKINRQVPRLDLITIIQMSSFLLPLLCPASNSLSLNVIKKSTTHAHDHSRHQHHKDDHDHKAGVCEMAHYGENPDYTKLLVGFEEKIFKELSKLVPQQANKESQDLCHNYLSRYLKDYSDDTLAIEKDRHTSGLLESSRAEIVVENPIFSMKLMRRLVTSLLKNVLRECKKINLGDKVYKMFEDEGLVPPSKVELKRAYSALVAITFVYGLNTTSTIRQGMLAATSAQLSFEDLIGLSNQTLGYDEDGLISYHWLIAAQDLLESQGDSVELDNIIDLDRNWKKLMNITGINSTEVLHGSALRGRWESTWHKTRYDHDYLCRGEGTNMPKEITKQLDCFTYYLKPFTVRAEIISESPFIVQYNDLFTDKEVEFMKNDSPVRVVRPDKFAKRSSFKSDKEYKDALNAKLIQVADEKGHDPIAAHIVKKVEAVTKLKVTPGLGTIYEMGLFTPLSQFNNVEKNRGTLLPYNLDDIPFGSFIMFLSDVRAGGYISFPDLNVFVRPEKKSAIFFYNYNVRDTMVESLYHEFCPVVMGMNEIANIRLNKPADGEIKMIFD